MTEETNRMIFRVCLKETDEATRIIIMNWIDRVAELFISEQLTDEKYLPDVRRRCKQKALMAVAEIIWDYPDLLREKLRELQQ